MSIKEHPIYAEVAEAYFDSVYPEKPWKEVDSHRNLDFRASDSVDRDTAIAILKEIVPSYNAFYPKLLEALPADCQITIAREGSVCLYVKGLEKSMWAIPALECDEWAYYDWDRENCCGHMAFKGETRIWWD